MYVGSVRGNEYGCKVILRQYILLDGLATRTHQRNATEWQSATSSQLQQVPPERSQTLATFSQHLPPPRTQKTTSWFKLEYSSRRRRMWIPIKCTWTSTASETCIRRCNVTGLDSSVRLRKLRRKRKRRGRRNGMKRRRGSDRRKRRRS